MRVQRVLTDNGSAFRSKAFREACAGLNLKHRFTRAYRKARAWVQTASAAAVAAAEQSFFPEIAPDAMIAAIRYYQELGCWAGDIAIDPAHYETALDVFAHSKLITRRHPYNKVVVAPPA